MDAKELPSRPSLEQYKKQAKDLVKSRKSRRPGITGVGQCSGRSHPLPGG